MTGYVIGGLTIVCVLLGAAFLLRGWWGRRQQRQQAVRQAAERAQATEREADLSQQLDNNAVARQLVDLELERRNRASRDASELGLARLWKRRK